MPEPRLSEERIDWLLDREVLRTPQSVQWNSLLEYAAALRQLRGDLEHVNHMRAVYDAENQESLRLLRLAEAERDQARAQVQALREALGTVVPRCAKCGVPAAWWSVEAWGWACIKHKDEDFDIDPRWYPPVAALAASAEEPALNGEKEMK